MVGTALCAALALSIAGFPVLVSAQDPAQNKMSAGQQDSQADDRALMLDAVEVSADVPGVYDPIEGYVPLRSATATKTGAPLIATPQSVDVATRDQLEERGAETTSDAVAYTSGVRASPFGFEPRFTFIRIRGFDVTDNALYRDGLKLVNPPVIGGSGNTVSYNLVPYGAERIEVLKGPASVLYGQASPGGLVNYVSKRPLDEPFREVVLQAGSHDRLQGQFDFTGPIDEAGEFSYRLTGLVRDSDTQVDFIDNDRVYIAPAFTWQPSDDTSLTLLMHYQEDHTRSSQAYPARGTLDDNPNGDVPRDRFTGEPDIDTYDRTNTAVGYIFKHAFRDNVTFRQKARHTSIDLQDESVYAASVVDDETIGRFYFGNFGQLDGLALDNQVEIELGSDIVRHVVLAGVDVQTFDLESRQTSIAAPPLNIYDPQYGAEVDVESATAFADQQGKQEQLGLYLSDRITFNDKWILSLGGRYDWADRTTDNRISGETVNQDDDAFTGRAGLLYRSDIGLSPYVSYSESFLPSLGAGVDGKPFEPETAEQYEIGVKYQPEGFNAFLTVALFELERNDFVQLNSATVLNEQTGQAVSRGMEVAGVASLAQGLNVTANYTYLDAEITESTNAEELGQRPQLVPEHQASLWLDYTIQQGVLADLGFGAGVRYQGSVFGDNANSEAGEVPDFTLVDAALHYDYEQYRFSLNAENVFDKQYVASSFARGGGFFATYGQARNVTASVQYNW